MGFIYTHIIVCKIYLCFNFHIYNISKRIKFIMAPFLGLQTLQSVFYSLVNALNYDLIIFFTEIHQVFPSKYFRM